MKTRIIKPLLAIACLLCSINASAYEFEVDGIYYDIVPFSDSLSCKVVKGEKRYNGNIVIPANVNYLDKTLTVVEIEVQAFMDCWGMTGITIPNTITSIDDRTFEGCYNLEQVSIEDGETELKLGSYNNNFKNLFYHCPIKSLYIGRNLWYAYSPFSSNEKIENVTIGNTVTKINSRSFSHCIGLTSVTIGNSVTEIGTSAFSDCSGLTSIIIPNSVTEIGENLFKGCCNLTSVTIPNSVTEIGRCMFQDCSSLTSVVIPNSVTEVGIEAFLGCSGLINVTIGNSVTDICQSAFEGCRSLTSVNIPNSVIEIGARAFKDCSALMSMTIGNSVKKIGNYAFLDCRSLTELYLYGIIPPQKSNFDCFTSTHYMTLNVYVPQEALEVYQSSDVWKNFWNLQGFDATGIKGIEIDGKDTKGRCFDLRGNRLDAPKSGVNIINGRKVMVNKAHPINLGD